MEQLRPDRLCIMEEETETFSRTLATLSPEVQDIEEELKHARFLLKRCEVLQLPQGNWLQNQLAALQSSVTEMKTDLAEISADIQTVLVVKNDTPSTSLRNVNSGYSDKQEDGNEHRGRTHGRGQQIIFPSHSADNMTMKPDDSFKVNSFQQKYPNQTSLKDDAQTSRKKGVLRKCGVCDKMFLKNNFRRHIRTHSKEKPFKCEVCGKAFKHRETAMKCRHKCVGKLPGSQHKCQLCNESFTDKKSLFNHEKEFNHASLLCQICGKTFFRNRSLQKHLVAHKNGTLHKNSDLLTSDCSFRCDVCHELFSSVSESRAHKLYKHASWASTFEIFKCQICDENFRSTYVRETHYVTSHSQEELSSQNIVAKLSSCDVCGKIVTLKYLKIHKSTHSAQRLFACEHCGKSFKQANTLRRHKIPHEKMRKKCMSRCAPSSEHNLKYKCRRCEEKFISTSEFQAHQLLHRKEKNHICGDCGKAFRLMCHLVLHKKIHTGEYPFICDVCGKGFLHKYSLKLHGVVHSKIKPFKCDICGTAFSLEGNLKRHFLIHSGERPFQCDLCGKSFYQKVKLQIHRRIHTGEKPFQCKSCGKKFSDPSTAHKHKTVHLKDPARLPKATVYDSFRVIISSQ